MDNLTHTLAGLALGELAHRLLAPESGGAANATRRRLLLTSAAVASNLPDLDLVLTPLLAAPLGYLLHHRGHTHTLLYALPQALLLLAALWLIWPAARRLLAGSARARRGLGGAIVLGLLLHLGMDGLNVYGIHPFAPFDARWYYGDMVFIVEPVFWVALGVPLAAQLASTGWRRLLLGLLLAVPLACTFAGLLAWWSWLGLTKLWVLGLCCVRWRGPRSALVAGVAVCVGFVVLQGVLAQHARTVLGAALRQAEPGVVIYDLPLSAFPANPLCWGTLAVTGDGADGYRIRRGVLSLAPGLLPAAACPASIAGVAVARGPAALAWGWETQGSVSALRALRQRDCRVDAWLRFARAPAFIAGRATDVRFGMPQAPNFSTLVLGSAAAAPCPRDVPRWGYPRADLLGKHEAEGAVKPNVLPSW